MSKIKLQATAVSHLSSREVWCCINAFDSIKPDFDSGICSGFVKVVKLTLKKCPTQKSRCVGQMYSEAMNIAGSDLCQPQ